MDETEWETMGDQVKWVVILVGGNDTENSEGMWIEQDRGQVKEGSHPKRIIDHKLQLWKQMASQAVRRVRDVVVWLPGIRRGGSYMWWSSWVIKLEEAARQEGAQTRWVMERGLDGKARYWESMGEMTGTQDGVHYTEAMMREVVTESLRAVGIR